MLNYQAVIGGESGSLPLINFSPSLVRVGFSKASQGYSFEPFFWECELSSMALSKGSDIDWFCGLVLFCNPSSKQVLSRGLKFKYLAWQPPGKGKVLKTSRLVIGRNSPAGWPARSADQPVIFSHLTGLGPSGRLQKKLLRDSFGPVSLA